MERESIEEWIKLGVKGLGLGLITYVGWVVLVTLYRWVRWIIRKKKYYAEIVVVGSKYPSLKLPDIDDWLHKIWSGQGHPESGELPTYLDTGFFGKGRASIALIKPE